MVHTQIKSTQKNCSTNTSQSYVSSLAKTTNNPEPTTASQQRGAHSDQVDIAYEKLYGEQTGIVHGLIYVLDFTRTYIKGDSDCLYG